MCLCVTPKEVKEGTGISRLSWVLTERGACMSDWWRHATPLAQLQQSLFGHQQMVEPIKTGQAPKVHSHWMRDFGKERLKWRYLLKETWRAYLEDTLDALPDRWSPAPLD